MTGTTAPHAHKPGDRIEVTVRIRDEDDGLVAIHGDTGTIARLLTGTEDDLETGGLPGPWYGIRLDHLPDDVQYFSESEITAARVDIDDPAFDPEGFVRIVVETSGDGTEPYDRHVIAHGDDAVEVIVLLRGLSHPDSCAAAARDTCECCGSTGPGEGIAPAKWDMTLCDLCDDYCRRPAPLGIVAERYSKAQREAWAARHHETDRGHRPMALAAN